MKRKVIVLLCACSLILSPAQFTYAQDQQQKQNSLELDGQKFTNEDALWEYLEKTYPTVTSTDIESGDYTGKYAIITSIARNVDVQPTIDYVTCDMYFHSGDEKYVLDELWCTFYDDEDMKEYEIEGEGLMARAICHELEHLDGHLYVEKVEGELHSTEYEEV